MSHPPSVRRTARRIGLQTTAAVAVAVAALAAVALLVVVHGQQRADDVLLHQATAMAGDATSLPAGLWLVVEHGNRETVTHGLPAGLPDQGQLTTASARRTALTSDITVYGREYRVDTTPLADGGVAQAVLDLSADHAERNRLLIALLAMGSTGLVLAVALGYAVSHRFANSLSLALAHRAHLAPANPGNAIDEPQAGPILLQHEVADAIESVLPFAGERHVAINYRPIDEPPPVPGSRAALRRAVLALLDNAIRNAHSRVTVMVAESGQDVVVDVSHDGPGISPDVMVSLFDNATMAQEDGVRRGIGLAVVSEVAARHGGTVSVVHSSGSGAAVRLRLPARHR